MAVTMLVTIEQKMLAMAKRNRALQDDVLRLQQQVAALRQKHHVANEKINAILAQLETVQDDA